MCFLPISRYPAMHRVPVQFHINFINSFPFSPACWRRRTMRLVAVVQCILQRSRLQFVYLLKTQRNAAIVGCFRKRARYYTNHAEPRPPRSVLGHESTTEHCLKQSATAAAASRALPCTLAVAASSPLNESLQWSACDLLLIIVGKPTTFIDERCTTKATDAVEAIVR